MRSNGIRLGASLLVFAVWAMAGRCADHERGPVIGPKMPVGLAWGPDGRLYVACRESREVLAVDPRTWSVSGTWKLPIRPVSMSWSRPGSAGPLLLGGLDGQFAVLDVTDGSVATWSVGRGRTHVLALPKGRAAIASVWDRTLRVLDWSRGAVLVEHPLDFSPGVLVLNPATGRLIVADAFGGRLSVVDPLAAESEYTCSIEGVNLRGLTITGSGAGRELLIVHMVQGEPRVRLSPRRTSTRGGSSPASSRPYGSTTSTRAKRLQPSFSTPRTALNTGRPGPRSGRSLGPSRFPRRRTRRHRAGRCAPDFDQPTARGHRAKYRVDTPVRASAPGTQSTAGSGRRGRRTGGDRDRPRRDLRRHV